MEEEQSRDEETMHDPEEEATKTAMLLSSAAAANQWLRDQHRAVLRQPVARTGAETHYYVKAAYIVVPHPDWDKQIINDTKKGEWSLTITRFSGPCTTCMLLVVLIPSFFPPFVVCMISAVKSFHWWHPFLLLLFSPSAGVGLFACLSILKSSFLGDSIVFKLGGSTTNNKELTVCSKHRWCPSLLDTPITRKLSTHGVKEVVCKVRFARASSVRVARLPEQEEDEEHDTFPYVGDRSCVSLRYANGRVVDLHTTPRLSSFHHILYAAQQLEVAILGYGDGETRMNTGVLDDDATTIPPGDERTEDSSCTATEDDDDDDDDDNNLSSSFASVSS